MTEKLRTTDTSNLDVTSFFDFLAVAHSTANSMEDYKRFYHNLPEADGTVKITINYGQMGTKEYTLSVDQALSP